MSELIISVSGVRGIVGETLTPQVACELAMAYAALLAGGGKSGPVALGRDSRPSGRMLDQAVCSGLLASGLAVRPMGVVATPTAALAVRDLRCIGGVVVTASHNPTPYNGIKFLNSDGQGLSAEQMARLKAIWQKRAFRMVDAAGEFRASVDREATGRHVARVLANVDVELVRKARLSVLLDSVSGAGGLAGTRLLEALGCRARLEHTQPTGRFPRTPEPIPENLGETCRLAAEAAVAVGFVQDPDADRLVLIDEMGRCVSEECTLPLAARAVLAAGRSGPIAANLSTSRMIDDVAAEFGVRVFRSPVGETNVAQAMLEHNCVFGGEGNGGVIDPRVVPVRDSITGIALVCELLARTGRPLSRLVADLPRYCMVKQKFPMPAGGLAAMMERLVALGRGGVINDADGVRIDWPDGWLHVRPSNTEPIFRVVAEARDEDRAAELIQSVHQALSD